VFVDLCVHPITDGDLCVFMDLGVCMDLCVFMDLCVHGSVGVHLYDRIRRSEVAILALFCYWLLQ
jgi:hypothetical protein